MISEIFCLFLAILTFPFFTITPNMILSLFNYLFQEVLSVFQPAHISGVYVSQPNLLVFRIMYYVRLPMGHSGDRARPAGGSHAQTTAARSSSRHAATSAFYARASAACRFGRFRRFHVLRNDPKIRAILEVI